MSEPFPDSHARPPARNMADIARLFLDGARPLSDAGTPRRVAPRDRQAPTAAGPACEMPSAPAPASPPSPTPIAPAPAVSINPLAPLSPLLFAITCPDTANGLACAAKQLAQLHRTPIGVLSVEGGAVTLDLAGEVPAGLPQLSGGAGPADMQIARALFTLRHAVDHWIIAAPPGDSSTFSQLAGAIAAWLIVTPADNDHVVGAYQELKHALAGGVPTPEPMAMLLSGDLERAGHVYKRLERAAVGFLKQRLQWAGVAPLTVATPLRYAAIPVNPADHAAVYAAILDELCGTATDIERDAGEPLDPVSDGDMEDEIIEAADVQAPNIAANDFDDSERQHSIDLDDPLDSLTAAAVDLALQADHSAAAHTALFDHLTNVLDPEEREALHADLFPTPPSPETQTPTRSPVPAAAAVPSASGRGSVHSPLAGKHPLAGDNHAARRLRAIDLPAATDRPAQWQAIETSIGDLLPGAVLLDARPPMPWAAHSCLAIDGAGTLHVWMLCHPAAPWFALRQWAQEHAELLALTRRELLVKTDRPVTTHLVLPLPTSDEHFDSGPLLRTAPENVQLYRLHNLQWHAQRGLIVVPLA